MGLDLSAKSSVPKLFLEYLVIVGSFSVNLCVVNF